jgi:predicted  nucleic acid-binding Zn-ribbon protein
MTTSSVELKRLRQRYYNLIDDLNSAIRNLSKVPSELEDAENYLADSFTLEETPIDNRKIEAYSSKIESDISKLRGHISKIEVIIEKLSRKILDAELEEKMSELQ